MRISTIRISSLFIAVIALMLSVSPPVKADIIAIHMQASSYQGTGFVQNIGWEFTTNASITVTQLGWFDITFPPFGDVPGFNVPHQIGIFTLGGQLLVTGLISPGTVNPVDGPPVTNGGGSITGDFRYVAVTPTTLNAGQSYVIAGTNPTGSDDDFAVGFALSNLFVNPNISFVQGRVSPMGTGNSLLFPTTLQPPAQLNARNFGPNFQFTTGPAAGPVATPTPEPSTLLLFAMIMAVLGAMWFVRSRANGRLLRKAE